MTKTAETLLRDALELDETERAEVAAALLESLEPRANEDEIELAWREEVRRRIAAADGAQEELIPWEEVRDELLSRLNARS